MAFICGIHGGRRGRRQCGRVFSTLEELMQHILAEHRVRERLQ